MNARLLEDTHGPGPPVVYVPGIDGTGELLLGTAERIAERFRLLRLRYETTGGDEEGDPYRPLAGSVVSCIAQAELDRAILLAESFGVGVALRAALDYPDCVAGLALVNGFARYDRRLRALAAGLLSPLLPHPVFAVGRWICAPRLLRPRDDPDARRAVRRCRASRFDAGYRRRLRMLSRFDVRAELGRITQPVSLFASDRDSVVESVPEARDMWERLPNASMEILHQAGHLVLPLTGEPWTARLEALATRAGLSEATPGTSTAP